MTFPIWTTRRIVRRHNGGSHTNVVSGSHGCKRRFVCHCDKSRANSRRVRHQQVHTTTTTTDGVSRVTDASSFDGFSESERHCIRHTIGTNVSASRRLVRIHGARGTRAAVFACVPRDARAVRDSVALQVRVGVRWTQTTRALSNVVRVRRFRTGRAGPAERPVKPGIALAVCDTYRGGIRL